MRRTCSAAIPMAKDRGKRAGRNPERNGMFADIDPAEYSRLWHAPDTAACRHTSRSEGPEWPGLCYSDNSYRKPIARGRCQSKACLAGPWYKNLPVANRLPDCRNYCDKG